MDLGYILILVGVSGGLLTTVSSLLYLAKYIRRSVRVASPPNFPDSRYIELREIELKVDELSHVYCGKTIFSGRVPGELTPRKLKETISNLIGLNKEIIETIDIGNFLALYALTDKGHISVKLVGESAEVNVFRTDTEHKEVFKTAEEDIGGSY